MIIYLNTKTCANKGRGTNHIECITLHTHGIRFSMSAAKMMEIKEGDKVVFEVRDGVMRIKFDNKNGFTVRKKHSRTTHAYVINNTQLMRYIKRTMGDRVIVGEFSEGGYVLEKYQQLPVVTR